MKNNQLQKNIPNGWNEVRLIDTVSFLDSKRIPIESDERSTRKGIYPYYGASGVIDYIDDYIFDGEFILLGEDGANIIDRSSRLAFIVKGKIWVNNHAHIFQAKENIKLYFLSEYLESLSYEKFNTGSAQPKLNRSVCERIPVLLPPLPEQNRIVSVLETWDKVIENLSKKIEIKKQIKKVLMQDLLTGNKRLSGFKDKWETKEIGELLDYEQPNKYIVDDTDYDDVHKIPVLTANKAFILGYTNETEGIYKSHPVIIFDDFTMDNKFVDFDFKVKSSAIKILTPKNKNVNLKFVFERIQLLKIIIGQHRRHYLSEFQYITIDTPSIKEQNAIAEILTTADREITELERKLSIIKEQKKYLLNNLITGTIRTPENLLVKAK